MCSRHCQSSGSPYLCTFVGPETLSPPISTHRDSRIDQLPGSIENLTASEYRKLHRRFGLTDEDTVTRRVRQLCKLFVGPQAKSSHRTRARNVLNIHNPRRAPSLAFTKTTIKRMLGSPTCEGASYLSSPLPNRMNRCLHLWVGPHRCLFLVCTTPHTCVVCFAAHLRVDLRYLYPLSHVPRWYLQALPSIFTPHSTLRAPLY